MCLGAVPPPPITPAGPLTLVKLSRGDFQRSEMVSSLIPAYCQALQALRALGVPEVQVRHSRCRPPMQIESQ